MSKTFVYKYCREWCLKLDDVFGISDSNMPVYFKFYLQASVTRVGAIEGHEHFRKNLFKFVLPFSPKLGRKCSFFCKFETIFIQFYLYAKISKYCTWNLSFCEYFIEISRKYVLNTPIRPDRPWIYNWSLKSFFFVKN